MFTSWFITILSSSSSGSLHDFLPLTTGNTSGTRVTWPMTVSSLPTPMSNNCVLVTLEHSLSDGCTAVLETGPLPPQDHKSGTVGRPISDYVGCHTASSGGYWRHFYWGREATAQCELFLTAPNRNILTYLLTSVLHISPRRINADVAPADVQFDCAKLSPLWSTGSLTLLSWRMVDGCPKSMWMVMGWITRGNVAKQTQSSFHYCRSDCWLVTIWQQET